MHTIGSLQLTIFIACCQKHLSCRFAKPQIIRPTITNCVSKWLGSIQRRQLQIAFWRGRLLNEHASKQRWTSAAFTSSNHLLEISAAFADGVWWLEGSFFILLFWGKRGSGKAEKRTSEYILKNIFESACTSPCRCLSPAAYTAEKSWDLT